MNTGQRMRVVIADDSEDFIQRLLATLGAITGVEIVAQAHTGTETLQAVRNLRPEVVILDIQMPEGSGLDVLASMKRECVTPITIVLTNFNYSQYRKKCLQLGARFFFDKSSEFPKVAEVVKWLIHRSSASPGDGSVGADQEVPRAH